MTAEAARRLVKRAVGAVRDQAGETIKDFDAVQLSSNDLKEPGSIGPRLFAFLGWKAGYKPVFKRKSTNI